MGGHPWFYYTEYESSVESALHKLRDREFAAGRYNPVIRFLDFPITAQSPAPGPQHNSIAAAIRASREDGTRSILDMTFVSPTPDFQAVCPLPNSRLLALYGTDRPSHEMIEGHPELFEELDERGQGVYIIVYKDDAPSEIYFAGYSFD